MAGGFGFNRADGLAIDEQRLSGSPVLKVSSRTATRR
jgi:hypothetical protein